MIRNNLHVLFSIAALLLATNVFAFSYFASEKIKIDTAEIDNTQAIGRVVEIMTRLGYTQGTSVDSNGVRRAVIEEDDSIRTYFLVFVSGNPSREQFEVTATLNKNKHEIEIYFRELMTKRLSDLGIGHYQSLVDKLKEGFGRDKVTK